MNFIYRKDDFLNIRKKYFSSEKNYFDPAHAKNSDINDGNLIYNITHRNKDHVSYNNDSTKSGVEAKNRISKILWELDEINIHQENITITPSYPYFKLLLLFSTLSKLTTTSQSTF